VTQGRFARATEVALHDGRYEGEIHPRWDIAGNANGGYLMAIAARALLDMTGRHDPVTVTAHFLSPGRPGRVSIVTHEVKSGRRFATATATLSSEDRPLLTLLGTFGDLRETSAPLRIDGTPPDLPPVDDCIPVIATETFPPPFMGQVELRLHPDQDLSPRARSIGKSEISGWFRLRDDEEITSTALLCALDAFPPTIFNTDLPVAWTPTIELTAHVRARPVPGWLRCRFTTRFITAGMLEEDGEIWDESGTLVAQSRQLALVPQS